jgi:ferrous iron transport protein B
MFPGMMSLLVMELPPYRIPRMKQVIWRLYERGRIFVTRAGKVIFLMSIVLWFLASYPKVGPEPAPGGADVAALTGADVAALTGADVAALTGAEAVDPGRQIRESFIGHIGRFIEPVMRPLGFDWKISASIVAAFAAREVLISTLATIYSVGEADKAGLTLQGRLKADHYPDTGEPVFNTLVAISLMVFLMLACQCVSTLAITRRETNSWRWPIFMWTYMMVLAYVASLIVYQGGLILGLG